ncbi:hypothetical protein ACQPZP_33495 [Spirillospora sp. CA-142024]|uniref:hypothetical protein n=1 Tax=Spirillospora sp. CA-142024 TaxID=3240036 RepID=UPI003D8B6A6B
MIEGDPRSVGADADERGRRFVEAFAESRRAPADADGVTDQPEPWLQPDHAFAQPLSRAVGVGPVAFRETFARPLSAVLSEVRGTVEPWARSGDTLFIALRLEARRRAGVRAARRPR